MLKLLFLTLGIMAVSFFLLGFRVFLFKGKKFPNTHIGGNKHLKKKGIDCVLTMDRKERGG